MTNTKIPHSREAEEATLGSVFINEDVFKDLSKYLGASDFHIRRHRWIWQAFHNLKEKNLPIDLLTVSDELDAMGVLNEVGGSAYLTALVNQVPSSLNADSYGWIVSGFARRREWIQNANQIAQMAYNLGISVSDIDMKVHEIIESQKKDFNDNIVAAEDAAVHLMETVIRGQALGIPSGLPVLDRSIGAMPYGETILIVGDATIGKTALCLQIAETNSMNKFDEQGNLTHKGRKVLYISTESKAHTLVARRACGLAGIQQKLLRSGGLSETQKQILGDKINEYMDLHSQNLFFDDRSVTADAIERSIATIKPELIVIDHLGELAITADNKTIGLLTEFDKLKNTAKKYGAAQIIIHTISADDAYAKGDDEIPNFNSLGWAKDLKYKADILLGLYPSKQAESNGTERRFLWVMKDREGARYSKVNLRFDTLKQWYTDTMY